MLKRILSAVTALLIVAGAWTYAPNVQHGTLPLTANAKPTDDNSEYTEGTYGVLDFKIVSKHVIITDCRETAEAVIIPAAIEGLPVTEIGDHAFEGCSSLTDIIIPGSVAYIGEAAFSECSSLSEVTVPGSVTAIERLSFSQCAALKKINILNPECEISPAMLTITNTFDEDSGGHYDGIICGYPNSTAQAYALRWSRTFEALTDEPAEGTYELLTYKKYADHIVITDCDDSAESVEIPSEIEGLPVTAIGEAAFELCKALASVTIPDSVTEIRMCAFEECSALEKITLPDGIRKINCGTFEMCESLKEITIPESVVSIEELAFHFCKSLDEITILNPKCKINGYKKTISNDFNNYEYGYCYDGAICGYENSTAQEYAEECGYTFMSLTNKFTKGTYEALTYRKYSDHVVIIRCDESAEGEIVIPAEIEGVPVTIIDDYAFHNRKSLTKVTLPDSITKIGDGAFNYCGNLASVNIPNSVTSIGEGVFAMSGLVSVSIPDSVEELGDGVFNMCRKLESAKLPDSITHIGDNMFQGCSELKSVTIPDSVTKIGAGAFLGCDSLEEITIHENITEIGKRAFMSCENLKQITILDDNCYIFDSPDTITTDYGEPEYDYSDGGYTYTEHYYYNGVIRGYEKSTAKAYAEKWGYTFEALEDDDTEWNYGLFRYEIVDNHVIITDCKETAATVIIPAKIDGLPVTEIGENAFRGCDRLKNVTLPDTITSIGKAAFAACTALTEISLPNGITSIEDNTFEFCTNLKTVNIPDSVISIGEFAFSRCESLASISLPDDITNIGSYAFNYCSSITSVTIPAKVETIEQYTFDACGSLTEVTVLNPDCHFSSANCISNYSWKIGFNGTIYGYEGSTAQTFAQTCGYTFIALDKAPAPTVKYGDANCDGVVSIADATAILQHLGNRDKYALSEQGENNADVDLRGNGITAADAIAIQQLDAGLVSSLPVSAISYQQKPNP